MATSTRLPAVLFDLEDTLVPWQTVLHWQFAWRPNGPLVPERHALAAIKRCIKSWDRRRWQGVVGALPPVGPFDYRQFLRTTLTEVAGHSLPPEEVEAVLDRFQRAAGDLERFPDTPACLARLAELGHPVGVTTDLPTDSARGLLRRSGLAEQLLVWSDEGGDGVRLPMPSAYRAAAARLGRKPKEVLFVGDLYWSDDRAAHRAGLQSVLLDRREIWPRVVGDRISTLAALTDQRYFQPSGGAASNSPPTPA